MVGEMSAEEVRDQCLQAMGTELGSAYCALRNEVAWLHAKWKQYRQLYARSPKRIELLNQAASHLFGVIQASLLEDVVLHIARLTDPPQSAGKDNLSLRRLPALISEGKLAAEVEVLLEIALNACKSVRVWRNRQLAHHDLALAVVYPSDPLPGISRAEVETAFVSIRAVLNRLSAYYLASEVDYKLVINSGRDADSLVYYLRLGLQAEEQRLERLERGEPLSEDFRHDGEV